MNVVSHCNRPRSSNSAMNARQMRSQMPSSSQRFKRRRHVNGLGYSVGTSAHRASAFSTQRIRSTTARLPIDGRPPRAACAGDVGATVRSWRSCASVKRALRLATSATSGQCSTAVRETVQALPAPVRS